MTCISSLARRAMAALLAVGLGSANAPMVAQTHSLREGTCAGAQQLFPDNNPGPGSLKALRPLEIQNLDLYVRDRAAAIVLGKALFWDMQVGSDGIQACASCHFRAGADPRSINQASPGGQHVTDPTMHLGINRRLAPADFPLRKLADPAVRTSRVLRDVDAVVPSQGVRLGRIVAVTPGAGSDAGVPVFDPVFNLDGLNTRRAEPRNTPTVINAAFNRDQFWDGRAETVFNGVNPFGVRDAGARVLRAVGLDRIQPMQLRIDNAALASQAVGPPLSDREMGFIGRTFYDVGKRLVWARPLAQQWVHEDDSVLGDYAERRAGAGKGLAGTYRELVEKAFQPQWWQSNLVATRHADGRVSFAPPVGAGLAANEYTLHEYNFSLFFGLAIQLYEMTLVSDDAPVDRHFDGVAGALSPQQLRGLAVFTGEAACSACHAGAETTNNSNRILKGTVVAGVRQPSEIVERMFNGLCQVVAYDQSYYNVGVRPVTEDLGIGDRDPFGNPLAWIDILTARPGQITNAELLAVPVPNIADPPIAIAERTSTMGAFKVPNLRNVELTAPYFHNGGQATLHQVVEFYNRGGDFHERNAEFIDFEIGKLNLSERQIDDLVAFLGALTDNRVLRASAPFDHPQLFVPNGHRTAKGRAVPALDGSGAADVMLEVPATGRFGGKPLAAFMNLDPE
jgi:cytochrome c peroxidase